MKLINNIFIYNLKVPYIWNRINLKAIMKKYLVIFILTLILFSCKQKLSNIHIVLSKIAKEDSTSISLNGLYLKNSDSTFYKLQRPNKINFRDTIKIESIPYGIYTLEYIDIIGNKILKTIEINKNLKKIQIFTDSINTEKFTHLIPFVNLKNNNSYSVEMNGGCVASFHGSYKISRVDNIYYFESISIEKRILEELEINAIKKFESELLAINGKDLCFSTGRMTFNIISHDPKQIVDNTCNWNGWSNLFLFLNNQSR